MPYLWNTTAYAAVTSIAVITLYIAYVMPTWSRLVGTQAVAWVAFIAVLFMLPQVSPVTRTTFNYTPIAVLVVVGFAGIWWLVSAPQLYEGPKVQGTPEGLAAIEADLTSV